MAEYGFFDDQGFTITNPRTPAPWLHYLIRPDQPGTETFCSGVTLSGGGFDVRGTHENTLVDTRLHLQDDDTLGRYLYLKDIDTGEVWSATWQPVRKEGQTMETRLRWGRMEFRSEYDGIVVEIDMWVPKNYDGWVQQIRVKNGSGRKRRIEIYPFVPIHMGDALVRLLAGDNDAFFGGASFDQELKGIVFRRNHGIPVGCDPEKIGGMLGQVALYTCSLNTPETPWETDQEGFLGDRFHAWSLPGAVEQSLLRSRNTATLRRSCGAFLHTLELEAAQQQDFRVGLMLGSTEDYYLKDKQTFRAFSELLGNSAHCRDSLDQIARWWDERLGLLTLETPDPMINRGFPWLQYQCETVLILNRMKSRFHTGYEYGWGFRDILQDMLYLLPYRPAQVRELLLHTATQIFSSGQVYHNFFLSQPGNKSIEASDDPLWFVQALVAYCRETADLALLDEVVDYAEVREGEGPLSGSILEHAFRCIDRVLGQRNLEGLPFLLDCDWNDDLNEARENGEPSRKYVSVMVAEQLYAALQDFTGLLKAINDGHPAIKRFQEEADHLRHVVLAKALDEAGYLKRALSQEAGRQDLGTSRADEGQIFLEPQVFGVNSGIVDRKTGNQLLNAVEERLETDWGAMLCFPYFRRLSEENKLPVGAWNIEKEPPGLKENGGIFMHLNAWLIEAWCRIGEGKKACDLYRKILPEQMSRDQDRYRAEPYVYPEYVRGKEVEGHGQGGHTWLTGTAPTVHRALIEHIFGLQPDYEGLRLRPCPDPEWKSARIERRFRKAFYSIELQNPRGLSEGVWKISVDGKAIEGDLLPGSGEEKTYRVEAVLETFL